MSIVICENHLHKWGHSSAGRALRSQRKGRGSNPVVSTHRSLVSAMEGSCGAFSFAGIAKFSIWLYNKIVSSSGRSAALGLYRRCRSHIDYPGNTLRLETIFISFFPMLFVRIITFHYISLTPIDLRAASWYILYRSEMTLVRRGPLPEAEPDLPPKSFNFFSFSEFFS